jgi:hypothetical protein
MLEDTTGIRFQLLSFTHLKLLLLSSPSFAFVACDDTDIKAQATGCASFVQFLLFVEKNFKNLLPKSGFKYFDVPPSNMMSVLRSRVDQVYQQQLAPTTSFSTETPFASAELALP